MKVFVNKLSMVFVFFFIVSVIKGQTSSKDFADTFIVKEGILNCVSEVFNGKRMEVEEALSYVYEGDSSRLYCEQAIFNMENEKISGYERELFLPSKCFKIELAHCTILAYTLYDCQNVRNLIGQKMILCIIDKENVFQDSIVAYLGDDYEDDITGLINCKNGKVFVRGVGIDDLYVRMYNVNPKTLKYEIIKEQYSKSFGTSNLKKILLRLCWTEEFEN